MERLLNFLKIVLRFNSISKFSKIPHHANCLFSQLPKGSSKKEKLFQLVVKMLLARKVKFELG